ncbi:hypothetical protein FAF44_48620 [Nonomuraea sp. MG754425]|uniref:hypothetical protein n=1 Tax=Nonomuraea sp. MG754425 TaxID=2570319 RepID=UPI001F1F6102|nr:hypothetical protein [Nonomuraea sp. MG754425]MCF6476154.1 hypothetical protein [Nonomuraea sp. MG754425]
MSEVVPLPSFGEVFFDARGQERCLRVTWHEGTLVLSLWRGEMCTASFRMPMEDVGRLLDTLDEGFAEATGEQPAVPAHDPGTEAIPGTGTYHRPPQHTQPPQPPQLDERPAASLSPSDVLVARGPAPQDKLVASYGESAPPRDAAPGYGQERGPFTGPQYVETTAPQQKYTGDPFSGPQYTADYTADPLSGPHYTQPAAQPDPFSGSQYADAGEPVYQLPGSGRRGQAPLSTDPLGFPSQAPDPYQAAQPQQPPQRPQYGQDAYHSDPYGADPLGGRHSDGYQQPQAPQPSTAGLGTPMHGIPGAGRRRTAPQQAQPPAAPDYGSYQQQGQQPSPVDPLLALGRQDQYQQEQYQQEPYQDQYQQQPDAGMSRPYVGDPMFSTGERLRPEQPDYHERSDRREW